MEQLKCKSCGAPLVSDGFGRLKCQYCGMTYKTDDAAEMVIVHPANAIPLRASISIPFAAKEYMQEADIAKHSIAELTNKLAEGLAAYMKIQTREDPCMMTTIIRGEVRVIPPDFRF